MVLILVVAERVSAVVQWEQVEKDSEEYQRGIRIIINHFKEVTQVCTVQTALPHFKQVVI